MAHGTSASVSIPQTIPAGLACRQLDQFPRVKCARLVVMPHPGQGLFHNTCSAQAGSPNCWCVPCPRGSGFRHRAVQSSPASRHAPSASKQRVFPPSATPAGSRGHKWRHKNKVLRRVIVPHSQTSKSRGTVPAGFGKFCRAGGRETGNWPQRAVPRAVSLHT